MKKLIRLDFLPASPDCALLLLRVWLGLTMFLNHGLAKFKNFGATVDTFHEKMGIPVVFAAAAILAESLCSILLIVGLATRIAALFLATTMAVAFVKVHQMALSGQNSGELAFIYLAGFLAVLLAGPGRHSIDARVLK